MSRKPYAGKEDRASLKKWAGSFHLFAPQGLKALVILAILPLND